GREPGCEAGSDVCAEAGSGKGAGPVPRTGVRAGVPEAGVPLDDDDGGGPPGPRGGASRKAFAAASHSQTAAAPPDGPVDRARLGCGWETPPGIGCGPAGSSMPSPVANPWANSLHDTWRFRG